VDKEGPQSEQFQAKAQRNNVVPLPRDWLASREELVPLGRPAAEVDPQRGEPRLSDAAEPELIAPSDEPVIPPSAADFWGERAEAVQDVLQGPSTPDLPRVPLRLTSPAEPDESDEASPQSGSSRGPRERRRPASMPRFDGIGRARRSTAIVTGRWRRPSDRAFRLGELGSRLIQVARLARLRAAERRSGWPSRSPLARDSRWPARWPSARLVAAGLLLVVAGAAAAVSRIAAESSSSGSRGGGRIASGAPRSRERHPLIAARPAIPPPLGHANKPALNHRTAHPARHRSHPAHRRGHLRNASTRHAASRGGATPVSYPAASAATSAASPSTSSPSSPSVGAGSSSSAASGSSTGSAGSGSGGSSGGSSGAGSGSSGGSSSSTSASGSSSGGGTSSTSGTGARSASASPSSSSVAPTGASGALGPIGSPNG
jgi:hypothetical protein